MSVAALNLAAAAALIDGLAAAGVRDVVFSPGSRSTPLVLAADAREALRTWPVLDERVGGFFALGLARASGLPVALVCTSGSAGAHYLPAALEADRSGVPLVLVTADRPPELHDCGANQTVDQRGLLGGVGRLARDLGAPDAAALDGWFAAGRRAAERAGDAPAGPAHLNVAFREPLWAPDAAIPPPRVAGRRLVASPAPDPGLVDALADRLGAAGRGVVHCGAGAADRPEVAAAVVALARHLGWPVLAEVASGLRVGAHDPSPVVAHADGLLGGAVPAPDLVLRLGAVSPSRRVAAWLARASATVLVAADGQRRDPDHRAETLVVAPPAPLLEALARRLPASAGWLSAWRAADDAAAATVAGADAPWEGALARAVVAAMPDGAALHLGNSLPVRDADAFAARRAGDVRVFVSRGVSGIDGALATAAGEAVGAGRPTWALVGDLTCLHDLGGLLFVGQLRPDLTVVVVDNGGGGIFGVLPIAQHSGAFERCFLTPQQFDLKALCAGCGVDYRRADDLDALRAALAPGPGPRLIHVPVDRAASAAARAEVNAALARIGVRP